MMTHEDRFQDAVTAYEAGNLDGAFTAAEEIVNEDQTFGDAFNLLSAIAQDQGRLAEADVFARSAVATDGGNPNRTGR
jgi:Flp pilus assembly protein TadD